MEHECQQLPCSRAASRPSAQQLTCSWPQVKQDMQERMAVALQQVDDLQTQLEVMDNRHSHALGVAAADRQGLEAQLREARACIDDLASQLSTTQTEMTRRGSLSMTTAWLLCRPACLSGPHSRLCSSNGRTGPTSPCLLQICCPLQYSWHSVRTDIRCDSSAMTQLSWSVAQCSGRPAGGAAVAGRGQAAHG